MMEKNLMRNPAFRSFFNNCDGIFLNYNWSDSTLANSFGMANRSKRVFDVYVGLDVWGRGCPGGGGFNSAHVNEINKIFHVFPGIPRLRGDNSEVTKHYF